MQSYSVIYALQVESLLDGRLPLHTVVYCLATHRGPYHDRTLYQIQPILLCTVRKSRIITIISVLFSLMYEAYLTEICIFRQCSQTTFRVRITLCSVGTEIVPQCRRNFVDNSSSRYSRMRNVLEAYCSTYLTNEGALIESPQFRYLKN